MTIENRFAQRALLLFCALATVLSITVVPLGGGAVANAAAPPKARSYYVTEYNKTWAYNRGFALGQEDLALSGTQNHVAILDFGSMYVKSSVWYVTAFSGSDFTLSKAADMVYEFGRGYYFGAGSDRTSYVRVGLGTNNSGGTVTAAAGAALAAQAKRIDGLFRANLTKRQAYAVGANDFESWGSNSAASSWIDGYNAYSGRPMFLNYGSADGCPTGSIPTANSCNSGLRAETIWKVSWSGAAYPVPEIYTTNSSQAKQWKYLSLYAKNQHGNLFTFRGVMSQHRACEQRDPLRQDNSARGCPGLNNTPATAWTQLRTQLDTNPKAQASIEGPTDIRWKE
jgi:hypothetical protein